MTNEQPSQEDRALLATEMMAFVEQIPASVNLAWVKDNDFLRNFEAERFLVMRDVIETSSPSFQKQLQILDFGYLHGLIPEFLHRRFPGAQVTVYDRPDSFVFTNSEYKELISTRSYLRVEPRDIADLATASGEYDLIILGEIIEHLDPTLVARALSHLRRLIAPHGMLLITTPNAHGLRNIASAALGRAVEHPPIPDQTMGYGHIHLWSPPVLKQVLSYCGWVTMNERYTHGLDRFYVEQCRRHWISWRHQLLTRVTHLLSELRPKWRGFMIFSAVPGESSVA
jgi:2-polyprenyl-3-methyl-5-hydroxy-6-metoxy-1,4-benzoquinol methylase